MNYTTIAVLSLLVFLIAPKTGWSVEREHLQIITGVSYEEGDFGTGVNSKTVIAPLTVRYLGDRFDLGLTLPFVYQDSSDAVTIVGGQPEQFRDDPVSLALDSLAPGVGDLTLKGRIYLFDDPGLDSFLPSIAPFGKVKFPTADESSGLGTGKFDYGFGLEFDKQIYDFFLFSNLGYTFIGKPSNTNVRDKISAGGGFGYRIFSRLSVSAALEWSRSLIRDRDDPLDVIPSISLGITRKLSLSPYASIGLSDGSPDYGVGFALSYRFLRF